MDSVSLLPLAGASSAQGLPARTDLPIDASDDATAAAAWLRAKGGRSRNTFDSYRREAQKLLLWLSEQRLTLSDLKVADVHRFYTHLANPSAHWIRPRKPRRSEPLAPTQVLIGPLDARSILYSRKVLSQMCAYLRDAGYLRHNPFALSAAPAVVEPTEVTRWIDRDAWDWLRGWIAQMPRKTAGEARVATRARWLMALLYHTGLRREEVAHARMGDFVRQDGMWLLRVRGKGHKERLVTFNSALWQELLDYRAALGLSNPPLPRETWPLVASVQGGRLGIVLTPRAVGLLVQTIARQAAQACEDAHMREALERMSTHWMRHTNATHRLLAGASLETTQDELGHADLRTTRIYAKTSRSKRLEDAEKLAALEAPRR